MTKRTRYYCPLLSLLDVFEKKWNARIVKTLYTKSRGFNELKTAVTGITQGVLSSRLSELEHQGIVKRTVVREKPLNVKYSLEENVKRALSCWENKKGGTKC